MSADGLVDFKPPLTDGYGRRQRATASDAPPKLRRLALTQVPAGVAGNAQRGAWARGWCDGVRRRALKRNPYARAGSGFHHGMSTLYRAGWRRGRDVYDETPPPPVRGATQHAESRRELRERVTTILTTAKR